MRSVLISLFGAVLLAGCHHQRQPDGPSLEKSILEAYHLAKDNTVLSALEDVVKEVNCADSGLVSKKLVLAPIYHSWDTTEILLIPFVGGVGIKSSAYSDVNNRLVLINPVYIRQFALKNTLGDSSSYEPVLELMLLHEIGHFRLGVSGHFDEIETSQTRTGEQKSNTQPEFLTSIKKLELSADSLAIDLVKRNLRTQRAGCLNISFDIERLLPGMQFQLSGLRMIENFGSPQVNFLHDPSADHPNLELRVSFMNYFLFPNGSLRHMIDDYLYNRTVAPVHRQEMDPRIFQGKSKF